ncbi:MAG: SusC/RagA family TonB-linked outer membrane protein, partial [Tannerella sp.]|nr:SusC/RagA family TonB-linked outer membrane protein [Tannerella sp.]
MKERISKYQKVSSGGGVRPYSSLFAIILLLFALIGVQNATAQTSPVTGVVYDENTNEPLIGVSVSVKGTTNGTLTNAEGGFTLNVPSDAILSVSYVGYQTREVLVVGQQHIVIALQEDARLLDEVVVVGYGTMRKKDLTGSVTQIIPDKIAAENPKNIQDILRGTAGMAVSYDPTAKGGGSMQVRGQRSVYTNGGHNEPLIILDGMIFMGELSEINPDDIGQIDILKDASAAAIYGAQAANGVLLITTKKGKLGRPVVNISANYGITQKSSYREVWNPEEYIQHRIDWYKRETYGINPATGKYEAYQAGTNPRAYFENPANLGLWGVDLDTWRNNGTIKLSPGESDMSLFARRIGFEAEGGSEILLPNFLAGKTFDWYDQTFRTGYNQDYNASVSGASDRINYYLSMGYQTNEGAIQGNYFDNIRSNMKVEGKVTDWLDIGANVNFQQRSDGDYQPNLDINNSAAQNNQIRNSPYSNYRNEDGSLAHYPAGTGVRLSHTNYDWLKQYRDNIDRGYYVLNTIFNAKITLPFGFSYTFNAAPRFQWFHNYSWNSSAEPDTSHGGEVNRENRWRFDWSVNNQIHWDKTFNQVHKFNLTLVQEAERRRSWQDDISASQFEPSDALGFHNTANATQVSVNTQDTQHSATGMLARLFYSYADRYMLTGSIRRDGYSAFGQSNPYATFPSIGAAWTFTNESFFKWEPMNYGKLRVSWGRNGNRSLEDPYVSLSNLQTGGENRYVYINSANTPVFFHYLQISRMANPNLQWEKSEQINLGLDFGFLRNRIAGSIDFYSTTTHDMIMSQQLVAFAGFDRMTTNLGEVSNKGVDLSITTMNVR